MRGVKRCKVYEIIHIGTADVDEKKKKNRLSEEIPDQIPPAVGKGGGGGGECSEAEGGGGRGF